jgi:hypothetical protein
VQDETGIEIAHFDVWSWKRFQKLPGGTHMFQSLRQRGRIAKWLSAGVLASACLALAPPGIRSASAETDDPVVEVSVAPPAPLVEVVPQPKPHHFWVHGYWRWNGRSHVWVPGYYEAERRGYVFREPHWENIGGHWYFHEGGWHRRLGSQHKRR